MENFQTVVPEKAYHPQLPPLNIELSNRCNCRCPYCANPTLTRGRGKMSDAILKRLEEEALEKRYTVIGFHGTGEPLLRMDLAQILSRFRAQGLWTGALTTNGVLLSKERVLELRQAGLTSLYVSIDTLNADLYARTRGGKLERVVQNIQNAAQQEPNLDIFVGLMNHKEQTVDEATKANPGLIRP